MSKFVKIAGVFAIVAAFVSVVSTADAAITRDLTLGATGADVTELQAGLIAKGHLMIAAPTGYFGSLTQAAVAKWQAAAGISPAAGYFGPISRAAWAGSMGGTVGTPSAPCPAGFTCTPTGGSTGGSTGGALGGGEASLEDLNASSGDDDSVSEGDTAQVAEFEFDVEDGDVQLNRLDLTFTTDANGTSEEDEPWETFETVTIWINGKEVASEDVSDEDEWLEEDEPYVFRFTGLDTIVREGDQAKIVVEVEAQNGIDGINNGIEWTVYIDDDGVRGTDGEGIEQYIGDDGETVSFDVEEEGADDDLDIRSSSDDPDATTLQVEDNTTSDWYTVFAFDLESDDDSSDIEINDLPISFSGTGGTAIRSIVNDVKLVIDGEEFDDFDWSTTTGIGSATTTFDIDGDVVIEGGDRITVEVMAEFKALQGNYATGTTITASTTGAYGWDVEGADGLTPGGSASGERHTLRSTGLDVEPVSDSATPVLNLDTTNVDDQGKFVLTFDVSGFEDDAYVELTASSSQSLTVLGQGIHYSIEDASNNTITPSGSTGTTSAVSVRHVSGGDRTGNFVRVGDGETARFELTVYFDTAVAGSYRLQLNSVNFAVSAVDSTSAIATTPEQDFETATVQILN